MIFEPRIVHDIIQFIKEIDFICRKGILTIWTMAFGHKTSSKKNKIEQEINIFIHIWIDDSLRFILNNCINKMMKYVIKYYK